MINLILELMTIALEWISATRSDKSSRQQSQSDSELKVSGHLTPQKSRLDRGILRKFRNRLPF